MDPTSDEARLDALNQTASLSTETQRQAIIVGDLAERVSIAEKEHDALVEAIDSMHADLSSVPDIKPAQDRVAALRAAIAKESGR